MNNYHRPPISIGCIPEDQKHECNKYWPNTHSIVWHSTQSRSCVSQWSEWLRKLANQIAALFTETFGVFALCHIYNAKLVTEQGIAQLGEHVLYTSLHFTTVETDIVFAQSLEPTARRIKFLRSVVREIRRCPRDGVRDPITDALLYMHSAGNTRGRPGGSAHSLGPRPFPPMRLRKGGWDAEERVWRHGLSQHGFWNVNLNN